MKNYSRQREAIVNILKNTTCHPTAQYVYDEVRKSIPNISLGTVYRNLSNLKEEGKILAFKAVNGTEHFDGNIMPHSHFCCGKCFSIFDLFKLNYSSIESELFEELNQNIKLNNSLFYGVCENCLSQSDKYIN